MTFDPHKFLLLANALAKLAIRDSREEVARTAVGRFYYAIHLQARETLVTSGFLLPSFDQHRAVIDELRARHHPQLELVKSLKRLRIKCDYALDQDVTSADVSRARSLAARIWPTI